MKSERERLRAALIGGIALKAMCTEVMKIPNVTEQIM